VVNTTPTVLLRAAERYGTPLYLYDLQNLRDRVAAILAILPSHVNLLYSLKANPSLGLCALFARWGLGADVASEGEFAIACEAKFAPQRTMVAGPYKSPALLSCLRSTPEVLLSIDSISEFETLSSSGFTGAALLRLRPEFDVSESGSMGSFSRFGIPYADLTQRSPDLDRSLIRIVGFHVYSGSQMLQASEVIRSLRHAFDLCKRAADRTGVVPDRLNLGGGLGIPYASGERELDIGPVADELARLSERAAPARITLELGRYLVGPCGWYITRVVATQSRNGRPAVVVDGGVHHRADVCGLNLPSRGRPPILLGEQPSQTLSPTEVLGCLCLPSDVLATDCPLPTLSPGDILAFPSSGAYGLSASPLTFLSHSVPCEVAVSGDEVWVLRARGSAQDIIRCQAQVPLLGLG
jgi:diaminopimelate decarboxylase